MCTVVSVCNQKGGVGKTTTAINLGVELKDQGHRVLLIDGDPQANLTMAMGYDTPESLEYNICTLIQAQLSMGDYRGLLNKCLFKGKKEDIFFLPSNLELANLEILLLDNKNRENILKKVIANYKNDFDYIIIDCPPSLGIMIINILNASDEVIIPVAPEYFSAKGLELLLGSIAKIKSVMNPNLNISGILITMLDLRSNHQREVIEIINDSYGKIINLYQVHITRSVKVSENQSKGSCIVRDKKSKVGKLYKDFIIEYFQSHN